MKNYEKQHDKEPCKPAFSKKAVAVFLTSIPGETVGCFIDNDLKVSVSAHPADTFLYKEVYDTDNNNGHIPDIGFSVENGYLWIFKSLI